MAVMTKELAMFLTNCVADFLDRNTSGMCMSSKQCEELERCFCDGNFAKIEIWTRLRLQEHGNKT